MAQGLGGRAGTRDQKPSRVTTRIDFEADGKRHDYLNVPHSRDDSAWGTVRVPITVVKNGAGPTLLFIGGNHGDEYEGPIALMKLARALEPADIAGRVVILPALNFPAVQAGTRLSPIDGRNMNRVFPGRRDGTVTEMIAHFVHQRVLPLADAVVDIHSGGRTLNFVPSAIMHLLPDQGLMRRTRDALLAFGAPNSLLLVELDNEGMLDTAVEDMGKVFLSTELGGGATVTTETLAIAETGVHNLLRHFGLIEGAPIRREDRGLAPTRLMHVPDGDCFVVAEEAGMYEVLVDLGAEVRAGDPVGQTHFIETPARAPRVYRAERPGTLVCRHVSGLARSGDCLAVIASDYRPDG
jgi:N-alpha-acetyl-L-2,4-diaminobutyrate deacetylase